MGKELIVRQQEENRLAALKTSPEQYYKTLHPKTIDDVLCSHEPAIGTAIKKLGMAKTRAILIFPLADVLEFFNVGNTMSDVQVAMTVDLIIEEYPYMKMDDLKLCFKNAMKLKYGENYNRIDGSIIMGWLREYDKERYLVADNHSWNEHKACLAENAKPVDGMFYEEYRKELQIRADSGDKDAVQALSVSDRISSLVAKKKYEKQKMELQEFYESQNQSSDILDNKRTGENRSYKKEIRSW